MPFHSSSVTSSVGLRLVRAGAIDEDVDLAELGDDAIAQRFERGAIGDVRG